MKTSTVQGHDIFDEIDDAFRNVYRLYPQVYNVYAQRLSDAMSILDEVAILDCMRRDIALLQKGYVKVREVCNVRD